MIIFVPDLLIYIFTGMYKNVRNILFDFGGVIVSLKKQNALNRFKEIGFADIEEYLGEFRQKGIFLEYEEGKLTPEEFYREFRKLAGRDDISDDDIDSGWMAFLTGIPEYKFQLLKDLRKKYNVYLLSNTNPSIMKWAFSKSFSPEGLPINGYFEKCYLSYELGVAKPEQKIYELILQDSGINAAETLFLDDGQKNINVAKELGFQTYLANQDEDLREFFKTV